MKVKLNILSSEYDLTWLYFLWLIMSLGEEGTFLNGCFKSYAREKEKKKKKNNVLLGLFCHVIMIILS